MSKGKHFNKGIVKGHIKEISEEKEASGKNKTPYIEATVSCRGKFGNVVAFCRMWGKSAVAEFRAHGFKVGDAVYLEGMLSQYDDKEGVRRSNFQIFHCDRWSPEADSSNPYPRATVILTGLLEAIDEEGVEPVLSVRVDQLDRDGEVKDSNTFRLSIRENMILDVTKGKTYRFKAALAQDEDDFGDVEIQSRILVAAVPGEVKPGEGDIPF